MPTLALQRRVQRHRFAHHAIEALTSGLPRVLRAMTVRTAHRPAASTPAERVAFEAQQVRELARSYQRSDPGFAADLFAAAARHEGLTAD